MARRRRPIRTLVAALALVAIGLPLWAAIDDSVVLYLPLDDAKGNTTSDLSNAKNPAELVNNPSLVDGKIGKAMSFEGGKSTHVKVPITDALQLNEKFSVAFWVKRAENQISDWNYMVAGGTLKWAVIYNRNQNVYVWSTSGGGWAQKAVTTKPLTTTWTHVAVTHDTSKGVSIYFDAALAGEGGKPPKVDATDGAIMVGARNPGQEFFTGIIDDVFLFNRVISLDEIKTIQAGTYLAVESVGKATVRWAELKRH
ncbi:LamG domain-containing protein [Candidatus Poribacteria bacterium]|nr:LamG domain-containing protein [Candidatus Poribacteria bacterium]